MAHLWHTYRARSPSSWPTVIELCSSSIGLLVHERGLMPLIRAGILEEPRARNSQSKSQSPAHCCPPSRQYRPSETLFPHPKRCIFTQHAGPRSDSQPPLCSYIRSQPGKSSIPASLISLGVSYKGRSKIDLHTWGIHLT